MTNFLPEPLAPAASNLSMRWTPGGRSDDLEDQRGGGGGGFGGLHLGIGGVIVVFVLSLIFKRDFFQLLGPSADVNSGTQQSRQVNDPKEEPLLQFVSFVTDDVQKTWTGIFAQQNKNYTHARIVVFRDSVNSGCGMAQSATGPFYCPEDQKVYIDLGFYQELKDRFGAPGDFAQAYVLAHEFGHHVQNLLGIDQQMRQAQQGNPGQRNALSVKMELQADCFAGVWGHSAQQRNVLEPGDVEEALAAASAIGDDRLQKMGTGHVQPDSFTHGTSAQRVSWFRRGFDSGDPAQCNTFAAAQP